jgi:2,3-dihydroxybenzoate decarboxylase
MHPRTIIAERAQAYEGHPWLYSSAWGFSVEASIHSLRLIGSGLFDDHPKLQIILGHLGERIPFDMWRLDHRIERLPCGYSRPHPMSYYLKNNFHMTTSGNFYGPTFEFTVNEMGIERIMFSVDYPFEDTTEGATWFDEMEMTEDTRLKIGRTNAIELFKLDLE